MPKKKPAKNAFSFFLDDYVDEQRSKGRNISHRIGAEECALLWKNLSEEKKQDYGKLAGAHKALVKSNPSNKFTTSGLSYEQVMKEQDLNRKKIADAEEEMTLTVNSLSYEKLKTKNFHLVHCNYYCKSDDGNYVPGELAISSFSLQEGIINTYHVLISPDKIPLGFAYEAQQNIDEVHGLPYPPFPEGSSNYSTILSEISDFLGGDDIPPLYCIENNLKATENIFKTLAESSAFNKLKFRIYPLHKIFFYLKNKCAEYVEAKDICYGFPFLSNAIVEIEKDIYCYVNGLSCNFHDNIEEKYQNCSLSIVKRYVYLICDHCCQYLGIQIIPGKHCRLKCDIKRYETVAKIEKKYQEKMSDSKKNDMTKERSEISDICSFYGGANVPQWTKITSEVLGGEWEDETDTIKNERFSQPSSSNGCRGVLPSMVDNSYDKDFPVLNKGRGRFVIQ